MLFDSINKKKWKTGWATILSVLALCLLISTRFDSESNLNLSHFANNNDGISAANSQADMEANFNMYVPGISIVKSAPVFNGGDCAAIPFTYTVTNQGDEELQRVVITDLDFGGIIAGPDPKEFLGDNGNDILDPLETWTFEANYAITQTDLDNGQFTGQIANVNAELVSSPSIEVGDMSHPSDPFDDGPTIVDITACQNPGIGLIKDWSYIDLDGDNPPCAENFLYKFTVRNTGNISLQNILLEDNLLGGTVPGPDPGFDNGNDNILSPGEEWEYQALYSADLQQSGTIINQATVTAETLIQGVQISDLSDDDSFAQDDPTPAPYDEVCTGAFARIGLVMEASPLDLDSDGCNDAIQYTFTVQNVADTPLENIVLNDDFLGDEKADLTDNGNGDAILDVGEAWVYQGQYDVTQDDVVNGFVANQALVTARISGFAITLFDYSDNNSFDENDETIVQMEGYCGPPGIGLIKRAGSGDFLVDTDGDGCAESIHYEFIVANTGGVDLEGVVLTDDLLDGEVNGPIQGSDINNDGVLSVQESWTYEAYYPLTQNDIDAGSVTNQAQVYAFDVNNNIQVFDDSDDDSFTEDQATVASTLGGGICVAESAIELTKIGSLVDVDVDGCFESIRYDFLITNTGSITLDQVVLNDILFNNEITGPQPNSDDNNDGLLSPQEAWSYIAIYPIDQDDIDSGSVANQAQVTAHEQITNNQVSDTDEITTALGNNVCVTGPRIEITKNVGQSGLLDINTDGCNETLLYTFIVGNTGTAPLENVVLNDDNLGGVVNVQIQGDTNNDQILSVGEQWSYQATYSLSQTDIDTGSVTNQAQVTAFEEGTANQVSDQDEITTPLGVGFCASEAGIELTKFVGSSDFLDLNGDNCVETIRYNFTISNTGTIDLEQISILDDKISGVFMGPQNDTDTDGILSVGEQWSYQATYPLTQTDIDTGSVTNQAQVTAFEQGTTNQVTDVDGITTPLGANVCIAQASIGLIKTAGNDLVDVDNDGCPENIQYTFTVKNNGTINLEQIVLSDILLGGTPIEGPLPGNDINSDEILSPDETWSYQALYPITEQDSIAGVVRNQAQVSAVELNTANSITDDSDNNSFDENDETITSIAGACVARAGIELIKTGVLADQDGDNCEESIQYTFTVENTGAINLYQILLEDDLLEETNIQGPLAGSDINTDGVLSIDETWTFEAFYSITQQDIDEGKVTNQAMVSALELISNNPITDESDEIETLTIEAICVYSGDSGFKIYNGISPNGDGVNDYFEIEGIENYPDNTLKVFNRWGVLVFEMDGYGLGNKLFNGHSDSKVTIEKNRRLPSGTYFYTLTFHGNNPGKESYSGYLYINQD
ncbi:gliding motility-associated C-terminal domain-containing protein [Allomuricauda sp. CP2A]|jgi:gliding motility-associated-like protein/uncharacterized repeat protein (TIGR01451 family)|uniref:gliding motility-associated C-terminal domain-containing protein n=1 Tax=Allomuricauda sp. CP2A TaxID=1848189 RepID=UPI00082BD82E|nr:gliding motility-associated C-terminal domain-containing protein [Muricauda sp. CP2A]